MKRFTKIAFASILTLVMVCSLMLQSGCNLQEPSKVNTPSKSPTVSAPAVMLKSSMRKLWEEHVAYTRNVILCLVDEVPGTEQAMKRLMQNQVDLGNAFKTYYGDAASSKLTELLYAHVSITAEVIKTAQGEDSAMKDEANKKWYANADEIAVFLSGLNPNWPLGDLKMMMSEHLKWTADEATQRINQNYDADIIAYDKVHNEILKMSDMLSDGIIKQFPDKF